MFYQFSDQKYTFSSNYHHFISNYIGLKVLKFLKKYLKSVLSPYFLREDPECVLELNKTQKKEFDKKKMLQPLQADISKLAFATSGPFGPPASHL